MADLDAHGEDVALARACAAGDAVALETFESRYMSRVPDFVARLRVEPAFVDELKQVLRAKLFVALPPARPKIAEYSGSGALERWFRIAAVNTALKLLRRGRTADRDELARVTEGTTAVDPELELVKRRYSTEFDAAFLEALAGLETRERNVLRLHFVDGLGIDAIGALHRVHRATAARWLAAAREGVLDRTRSALRSRLHLTPTEIDSLVAVVQSRLEVSLRSLLASASD
jgi:RNA polymerase sigma-70 factor (ECF subfamily)